MNGMPTHSILKSAAWLGVALAAPPLLTAQSEERPKPNIILILADDMGYGDCGVYNPESKIKTPHIDQLAKEGLLFTDAHAASSTCTPSRYGLLTGINPARTGVRNTLLARGMPIIDEDETTVASLLRDQGYVTQMVGKWHLGFEEDKSGIKPVLDVSKPLTGGPVDRGFDTFYGMHSSPGASPLCYIRNRTVEVLPTEKGIVEESRGGSKPFRRTVMMAPEYRVEDSSPLFCKEAVDMIHAHAASKDSNPFFLYYASPLPHKPWVPTDTFRGKSGVGPYGDFIMQLDDVVGQINTALKETGLDQRTLLIFTSDNGPGPWAAEDMNTQGHASSGPLRGMKAHAWEGGHRVPFIAKWPGHIPAGRRTAGTINFTDFFATLAQMLDVNLEKAYPGAAPDSESFLDVMLDPGSRHRRGVFIHHSYAIRDGDWVLVSKKKPKDSIDLNKSEFKLFNLAEDLSQKNDLSKTHPEKAKELFAEFEKFAKTRKPK